MKEDKVMKEKQDNKVAISVVIPCYNDGKDINTAIDSLNAQTDKDFEIIVIDDASTDESTKKILSELKQDNLQVLFSEKNSGPAVARNTGIEIAQGDYILPLDADDKIAPTYLEKAKAVLDMNKNMGIVYCEAEFFGQAKGKWDLPPYSFPEILASNMIFATAMYRKRDWIKVGGYNSNMIHGNEDYDFWISLIEKGCEVYQIPEVLFYYRIKETSRTTLLYSKSENEMNSYLQMFDKHEQLYIENIRLFFETMKRKQSNYDEQIRKAHKQLQKKDDEIVILHQKLYESLQVGEDLAYARSVVALRDKQIEFRNKQIEFRDKQIEFQNNHLSFMYELTLKKRLKQKIKKMIPDTLLTLLGYKPYEVIAFDTTVFPKDEVIAFDAAVFPQELLPTDIRTSSPYVYLQPELTLSIKTEIDSFHKKPLISIVMPVYNVDPKWLDLAIQSIENQWYDQWELCIADDKSTRQETLDYLRNINNPKIKITFLEENLNISGASNAALALAEGEYIALMDNDDELTADALFQMLKAINEGAEFIYSDEDFISTDGECNNPHFKSDFAPDLLLSHNYITHFTCFSKELLDKVGYFKAKFDGAQDYDLFLRLTEETVKIHHIQKVLYHWRTLETSTSMNSEAKPEAIERGRLVLDETMKRRGIDASIEHANMHHYFRVKYTIQNNPLVSIIIPFKDKQELLDICVNSILEKSTYQNYEIIGVSNNSEDRKTFEVMSSLEKKDSRISFYEYNTEFNYADINNHAVNTYANGEHVLLLNNDIEVITPDWIEAMLEHSQREGVGCVGAKLYFPDDTVQHAGIIIGLGGYAGHSHKMYPRDNPGYFNRLGVVQNVSAVTAACLMIKKHIYQEINGMNDIEFKVAYNDVDFCLRVLEQGYLNIFTPFAEMYHHESISRGYETTPEKIARFQTEKDALSERHKEILINGDPYYNPNLTQDKEDFSLCEKQ